MCRTPPIGGDGVPFGATMPPMNGVGHIAASGQELDARGWAEVDVCLVTGDANVDHPSFPANLLGRVLESDGYRVGILARPDVSNPEAITLSLIHI